MKKRFAFLVGFMGVLLSPYFAHAHVKWFSNVKPVRESIENILLKIIEFIEEDNKFCTLFTELKNPTSNSIHMKIGYKPLCDFDSYYFIYLYIMGRLFYGKKVQD
jgi:hypothetical protein